MHTPTRTRFTPALLLTLALTTTPTRADTFTWAGATANFSDPASWSGPAPLPTGSPTTQLLFPTAIDTTANAYTATLDTPAPFTLNTVTVGLPDTTNLNVTINAAPGASLQFTGPNPTITAIQNGLGYTTATINTPISTASDLTLSSFNELTLDAPLTFSNGGNLSIRGVVTYNQPTAPTGLNKTTIASNSADPNAQLASFTWSFSPADATPLSFGSNPILLSNGVFTLQPVLLSDASPTEVNFATPFKVDNTGVLNISTSLNGNAPQIVRFTGNIQLHGYLNLDSSILDSTPEVFLTGLITLDQSPGASPLSISTGFISGYLSISGNIVDDPDPSHTAAKPLWLDGPSFTSDPTAGLYIDGTNNTYSTGTLIEQGNVFVSTSSRLGTGNVAINGGGILHLSSPANISPGNKILITGPDATLAITFDQDPSALLDPASNGFLALDTTFTTPLNMSKLGDGTMLLGSTNNSTYIAPSLLPATDHIYRFGASPFVFPAAFLTVANSVLRDYNNIPSSAQLANVILNAPNTYSGGTTITGPAYVNAPGALGTGDINIGDANNPGFGDPRTQQLFLTIPNAYPLGTHINIFGALEAVGANGAIPNTPINLQPGSTLTLGDNQTNNPDRYPDSLPLALNNSTLILKGYGATTETIGPLSVSGLSAIALINYVAPNSGGTSTLDPTPLPPIGPTQNSVTLVTPSLQHADHAVLFIVPSTYSPNTFSSTNGIGTSIDLTDANFQIVAAPEMQNGMVAPWLQSRNQYSYNADYTVTPSSFLAYASTGFVLANYIFLPTSGGTGTEIVDIPIDPTRISPVTLPMETSLYALRTANSILNPASGPVTLHILSGGLIAAFNSLFSVPPLTIQPNVDFGNAEAYVNVDGVPGFNPFSHSIELAGIVTSNDGLTKFGEGTLLLSNPNNQIHGPITIHEGTLQFAALPDPNSSDPITLAGDAELLFQSPTTISRPIVVNGIGTNLGSNPSIQTTAGQDLTITRPIVGQASLSISSGANLHIAGSIQLPNITLTGSTIRIDAPITASTINLDSFNAVLHSTITADSFEWGYNGSFSITGSGTIASSQTLAPYLTTFSPGDNPGDLATFALDAPSTILGEDDIIDLDLTPAGLSDRLLLTGLLEIDPPTTLNLNFLAPPTGQTYTLLTASSLTGQFTTVTGLPANYTLDYTPTSLLLLPTSQIPEPTTLPLLALTTISLILSHRRTRRFANVAKNI